MKFKLIPFLFVASLLQAELKFHNPVIKDVEGWTIKVDPALFECENEQLGKEALTALANHLQRVKYILPEDRVKELQKLPIDLDLNHSLGNMQYHPEKGWLMANRHDPRLEKHVHIPRAQSLINRGTWAKHPYVVLHELAHAYHDQVLGFNNKEILAAYNNMKEKGIYENVLLYTGKKVRHYALSNHKEYFAESTEAYLGVNDFYPFTRAELKEHDPVMYEIQKKIWGEVK